MSLCYLENNSQWSQFMSRMLITGANRGIGLEWVKQYAQDGWEILAGFRDKSHSQELMALSKQFTQIHPIELDVTDSQDIQKVAKEYAHEGLDMLVNNAGASGKGGDLGQLTAQKMLSLMEINTAAPLQMAQAFIPHLERGQLKCIVTLSSKMGSIADNKKGGSYFYRASKAALNALMKSLSIDLAPKNIRVLILHPGWVRTRMGGSQGLIDVKTSVQGMREVVKNANRLKGLFYDYTGEEIPW